MSALSGKIAFDGMNEAYHISHDPNSEARNSFDTTRGFAVWLRSKILIVIFSTDLPVKNPLHHFQAVVSRFFIKVGKRILDENRFLGEEDSPEERARAA
jgi:hypothetical protein